MTSPNPPELPYITPGIIWDGVTEYNQIPPPGVDKLTCFVCLGTVPVNLANTGTVYHTPVMYLLEQQTGRRLGEHRCYF